DKSDQRRRDTCSGSDAGEDDPIGGAPLLSRNPTGEEPVAAGIHDRLADAQEKSNPDQNRQGLSHAVGDAGGERRKDAPPDGRNPQRSPRSDALGKPFGGRL